MFKAVFHHFLHQKSTNKLKQLKQQSKEAHFFSFILGLKQKWNNVAVNVSETTIIDNTKHTMIHAKPALSFGTPFT
jgi:hypothetical protein